MPPLPPPLLDAVLDHQPVARLALRDLDGTPEALPIVFARAAGALWSPIDGKPKGPAGALGRLAKLEQAPRVMLLLDHYADDWSALWWIRLRATASVQTGKGPEWGAVTAALERKYPQYRAIPMFKDEPTLIRFEYTGVSWWASEGLAGITRWIEAVACA